MPHARKSEAGISIIPFTEKGITMKTISLKKWEAVEKQRHRYEIVVVHLLSRVWLFASHGLQHTRLPCPSLSPRVCSNLSPLRWHHFADKGPYSQSYGFSSSHVWMWKLDNKEGWASKNWCFWTVVLEKTLESLLDNKEIKPVNLKGNQPWIFIGRTDSELKLQYFGYLIWRANSFEKTLMLGKTEGRRRRGQQWMRWFDVITDSMDMSFSKLQEIVKERKAWHAAVCRVAKHWTQLSNWTATSVIGTHIF